MKFATSLLLMAGVLSAHAQVIVLSYANSSEEHFEEAKHLKEFMQTKYSIPGEFIELEASLVPCQRKRSPVAWHLCLNSSGDLEQVSADEVFIRETLRVFL